MASTVGDLMTTHVVAAFEEAGFKRLAVSLRMNGVSALPVLDADQRVVGVVSESDLLAWLAAPNLDEAVFAGDMPEEPVARDLMSTPAITITEGASPREAAERMRRHRIKRLPVVTEDGKLLGWVLSAVLTCCVSISSLTVSCGRRWSGRLCAGSSTCLGWPCRWSAVWSRWTARCRCVRLFRG